VTYDEKWDVLASYSKHKNRLKTLLLEREELRDLKKMSDDVGGVPTPGNVSDPTGNLRRRLMSTDSPKFRLMIFHFERRNEDGYGA
jgi:hypothetical protein